MYPSISPITMWISNCRLKYEQYKYTTYITSRVIMLTFIMHALHYWNSMCGPAVQALQWHVVKLSKHCITAMARLVKLSKHCIIAMARVVQLFKHHIIRTACVVQLFKHCITGTACVWSSCSSTALLQWHTCSPVIQALHYCNGT